MFYLDLNNYPKLSQEDTLKYVKKYQEAKLKNDEESSLRYSKLVIEGNLRLIIFFAKKYANKTFPLEELINEGFLE